MFRNSVDVHVSCGASPDEDTVFIEISSDVGGRLHVSAAQSHSVSLHHRKNRTLQDHRTISTTSVFLKNMLITSLKIQKLQRVRSVVHLVCVFRFMYTFNSWMQIPAFINFTF